MRDITSNSDALCELAELLTCDISLQRGELSASDADKTEISGYVKQPGERVEPEADVCPVFSDTFETTGIDLETGIDDLEVDLAFNTFMQDIRIPEECSSYR